MRALILAAAVAAVVLAPTAGFAQSALKAGIDRDAYIRADQARAGKAASRRFDRIDAGHKGMIDRPTYIRYYRARAAKFAARRFDRIDTNHDGKLEASELAAWREAHARLHPHGRHHASGH